MSYFWVNKLVGANLYTFCNYGVPLDYSEQICFGRFSHLLLSFSLLAWHWWNLKCNLLAYLPYNLVMKTFRQKDDLWQRWRWRGGRCRGGWTSRQIPARTSGTKGSHPNRGSYLNSKNGILWLFNSKGDHVTDLLTRSLTHSVQWVSRSRRHGSEWVTHWLAE